AAPPGRPELRRDRARGGVLDRDRAVPAASRAAPAPRAARTRRRCDMTPTRPDARGTPDAWALIEREKQRDRLVKRLCVAAWGVTLGIAVVAAAVVGIGVAEMVKAAAAGAVPWMTVVGAAMPFIGMLWTLSLLVAALSTVGVFLRMRAASLSEIQLRLAALEEMLTSRRESEQ